MSLFSVNTNSSAQSALLSLDQTQEALNQTQNEVSSGKKIGSSADNPAIYAIANTINANIAGLSAVSDSLNFGAQVVSTASSAADNISTVLQNLQQTVTESGETGVNLTTLQSQVTAEINSINQYARAATFNGVNVLTTTGDSGAANGTLNVVQGLSGTPLS
jgi:flagellin